MFILIEIKYIIFEQLRGPCFISYSRERYQSSRNMKCLALDQLPVGYLRGTSTKIPRDNLEGLHCILHVSYSPMRNLIYIGLHRNIQRHPQTQDILHKHVKSICNGTNFNFTAFTVTGPLYRSCLSWMGPFRQEELYIPLWDISVTPTFRLASECPCASWMYYILNVSEQQREAKVKTAEVCILREEVDILQTCLTKVWVTP